MRTPDPERPGRMTVTCDLCGYELFTEEDAVLLQFGGNGRTYIVDELCYAAAVALKKRTAALN